MTNDKAEATREVLRGSWRAERGERTPEAEVPAGPGDAGASDAPRRLETAPQPHPARRHDGLLLPVLWGVAIVALLLALL